jgi:large subunit ribosomal protein L25
MSLSIKEVLVVAFFIKICIILFTMLKLKVLKRDAIEKPEEVREAGFIPAVFYGPKEAAQSIKIVYADFEKAFKSAGESTVVTLDCDGAEHETLIHDVSYHPVRGNIAHVDFYVIEKGKKVQVNVPLEFTGVAPAEKTLGGTLVKVMYEIEIEAMPKDLPHEIIVDISTLVDFESQIHASDIKLPSGVTLITEAEEVVALVQAANEEEPETPSETVDIASIEVEKKGKKEEVSE